MKNILLKKYLPCAGAVAIFVAISMAYYMPEIFENKALYQNDAVVGANYGAEINAHYQKTGERTLWTNVMFGGMPTYQVAPMSWARGVLAPILNITQLYLPSPASILFLLLVGAFMLFLAFKVRFWLAVLGAIAYAFSSYFFIIVEAGHIWKVMVLACVPPTFAGIVWLYSGKYLRGVIIVAVYLALQLVSNHPQMTYYFGLTVLIYVVREFYVAVKNKHLSKFCKASGLFLLAGAIALSLNITNLYHTSEYTKYSIRGGSELTSSDPNQTRGGLDRSYITGWSYGLGETFTLMIPNIKGGGSNAIGNDKKLAEKVSAEVRDNAQIPNQSKNDVARFIMEQNTYWADQPMTSGPVYVGAFIIFLFIFGLFIVRNGVKWTLLAATLLSIFLSWGHNFAWLTNIFIDHIPYYNKFRAVSSILVIAELCIPVLAILTLSEIVTNPSIVKEKKRALYISLGCTAGLAFLFILLPTTFFSFFSEAEEEGFAKAAASQGGAIYLSMQNIIENIRISIFRADAWRSLFVIVAGAVMILLFANKKITANVFMITVTLLVLAEMWDVNKRYLNGKDFKPKQKSVAALTQKTPADIEILKDADPDYRVMNLSVSTFNDGRTTAFHKSIGGYHGAKMRRYQDIIEHYIAPVNIKNVQSLMGTDKLNVLDMLNTKYFILSPQQILQNPNAMGNAWFVDEIKWVNSADEEIAALADFDPRRTAVIDKSFETDALKNLSFVADSVSSIKLVEYNPNKLIYETNTLSEKLAVLSEIYYPKGWHAYIDGKEIPIWRANYVLRTILVPEGKHTVELRFAPSSYHLTESLSKIAYILLLALIVCSVILAFFKRKRS
ncbi:MAG: YfhO family protein [Prevotellaceae bacterium]|nr:YfhO family protein [Prevotellaceae bacterium]